MKNVSSVLFKISVLMLFMMLTSCYTTNGLLREARHENQEIVNDQISGTWKNNDSTHHSFGLFQRLSLNLEDGRYKESFPNASVLLEKESDSTLRVSLQKGVEVLDQFVLNGIFKKNCFVVDRKLKVIPFFPIYFIHRERKTVMGLNSKGQLVIASGIVNEGMILIIGAGHSYKTTDVFIKS